MNKLKSLWKIYEIWFYKTIHRKTHEEAERLSGMSYSERRSELFPAAGNYSRSLNHTPLLSASDEDLLVTEQVTESPSKEMGNPALPPLARARSNPRGRGECVDCNFIKMVNPNTGEIELICGEEHSRNIRHSLYKWGLRRVDDLNKKAHLNVPVTSCPFSGRGDKGDVRLIEDVTCKNCLLQSRRTGRIHWTEDGENHLCGYKYKNILTEPETLTRDRNRVECKRCEKVMG